MKKIACLVTCFAALCLAGCSSSSPSGSTTGTSTTALAALTAPASVTATVGSSYSATLTETGGTAPYTWTLGSSTILPTGLNLNSATGAFSGTPTQPGTFPITITVTDSSTPVQSKSVSFQLTIADSAVVVTTTTLPLGTVGTAFSQNLTAAGGYGAYTWSQPSGTLPPGLTLAAITGLISGTPTTPGSYTFTVQATDQANTSGTQSITLTIAPGPLTITTTSLPSVMAGQSYSQTLTSTGGSGGNMWTIGSGSLPVGLLLDPTTGIISGTPTAAGTEDFTATVTDSTGASISQALSINVIPTPLTGNAILQGQYFFKIDTMADQTTTTSSNPWIGHLNYAGSIILDGAGNITSGYTDYADDYWYEEQGPVTGTYSIGTDGRGTMTLNLANEVSYTFAIATQSPTTGATATHASLLETDQAQAYDLGGINYSTGFLQQQDPTAFVQSSLTGPSAFGWSGDTDIVDYGSVTPQTGGLSLAGLLDINSDLTLASDSTADIATNQTFAPNVGLTGTVEADSGSYFPNYGRALLNLTSTTYPDGRLPAQSVIYVIDSTHAYVISVSSNEYEPLFSGPLDHQSTTNFTTASLSGSSVLYGASQGISTTPNEGLDPSGSTYGQTLYSASGVYAAVYSFNGNGSYSATIDSNLAGAISAATTVTGSYTVSPQGRVTLSGANTPILWLSGPGSGFGTMQPTTSGPWPGRITATPQTSNILTGTYTAGVSELNSYLSLLFSGLLTSDGSGNLTGNFDFMTDDGPQAFGATPLTATGTYSAGSGGRGSLTLAFASGGSTVDTLNLIYYVISPTQAIALDETGTDTHPSLILLNHQ